MNKCNSDLFNKEADQPVAGQKKIRQEIQTKDTEKNKDKVRSQEPAAEEATWEFH